MSERKVIACNHKGNRYIREGSKAYVIYPNGGSGNQYVFIYVRTKGRRYVKKWENINKLDNFRLVGAYEKIIKENKILAYGIEKGNKVVNELKRAQELWKDKKYTMGVDVGNVKDKTVFDILPIYKIGEIIKGMDGEDYEIVNIGSSRENK